VTLVVVLGEEDAGSEYEWRKGKEYEDDLTLLGVKLLEALLL